MVSESHTAFLCFICGARVLQWINIVEAMAERHSQAWRKDAWWLALVNTVANNLPLVDTGNPIRNDLENFLVTVLRNDLKWNVFRPRVRMVRRWSFKLKVNLMINLRVSLRVCLREELRVVPSGMVRGRTHCRKQWVNLADLVIISRLGDHSLVNMVKDQYQQPTEVDMVD